MNFINCDYKCKCNTGELGPLGPSSESNYGDIADDIYTNKNIKYRNSVSSFINFDCKNLRKNLTSLIYNYFTEFILSLNEILK